MKTWVRLSGILAATATAVALTLTGASAAGPATPDKPAPSAGAASAGATALTARPPLVSEALFVPIAPCRIVDTRSGAGTNGTPLQSQQIRSYYVGGTTGFAPQGGKSGGCGIPVGAVSVAATLTAVDASHTGYLRAWPTGQTEPQATVLSYGIASTGTGATLSINPSSALALRVHNYSGPTDLVIDVSGYYVEQLEGLVDISGGTYAGTSRMVATTKLGTGYYRIQWNTNVSNCAPVVTVYGSVPGFATSQNLSTVYTYVRTFNAAGTPTNYATQVVVSC